MTLRVPANSPVGARPNLTLRAVAMFNGTPITHEIKLNVNLVK